MTIDYCYSPHPLDLSYEHRELTSLCPHCEQYTTNCICRFCDCGELAAEGSDVCAECEREAVNAE